MIKRCISIRLEEKKNIKNIRRIRDRVYVVPFTPLKNQAKNNKRDKMCSGKEAQGQSEIPEGHCIKEVKLFHY